MADMRHSQLPFQPNTRLLSMAWLERWVRLAPVQRVKGALQQVAARPPPGRNPIEAAPSRIAAALSESLEECCDLYGRKS